MIKFNFEVPLPHMKDFEEHQDIYFALNHLCEIPTYIEYIKNSNKSIILDNSYNELNSPDNPKEMIANFNLLNAEYVVSPDSDMWNHKQMIEAYKEMIKEVPQEKVLVVIRSELELMEFQSIGLQKYCVTYYHRKFLPISIVQNAFHFLGLNTTKELSIYSPNSCDTSMPLKLAMEGLTLQEWIDQGCPHIHTRKYPDFFSTTLPQSIIDLSIKNIKDLKELING